MRCKAPSTDVAEEVTALLLNENKNNFYSILTSSRENDIHSFIIYCTFQSYIFPEISKNEPLNTTKLFIPSELKDT